MLVCLDRSHLLECIMAKLMTTKEVHKLIKGILSKHEGVERTSAKTRSVHYIWRVPIQFRNHYTDNLRLMDFSISYDDQAVFQKALDEINVFLTLKGYPVKVDPGFRYWRQNAQIEIYANIR